MNCGRLCEWKVAWVRGNARVKAGRGYETEVLQIDREGCMGYRRYIFGLLEMIVNIVQ